MEIVEIKRHGHRIYSDNEVVISKFKELNLPDFRYSLDASVWGCPHADFILNRETVKTLRRNKFILKVIYD